MAEIDRVRSELSTAAEELGNGYTAAGEARRRVAGCLEMQARNVELLGKVIASITTTGEQLVKARIDSERSQGLISSARDKIRALGLEGVEKDNVSSLPGLVAMLATNQELYTEDMENQQEVAGAFVKGFESLRDELRDWCEVMAENAQDDAPTHVAFSEAVSQTSASVYEV